jgi:hypothetical protein
LGDYTGHGAADNWIGDSAGCRRTMTTLYQRRLILRGEESLEQRQIGKNGPSVGILGMGTMAMAGWYGERDDTAAAAAINRAIDLGITLFDTADLYGGGENERFVGSVLGPRRDDIVSATKWGHTWDEKGWPNGVNGRPERCVEACDDSLKRLGFDHIDLYYLHRVDPDVAIEETIGAMARLAGSVFPKPKPKPCGARMRPIRLRHCRRNTHCGRASRKTSSLGSAMNSALASSAMRRSAAACCRAR